MNEGPLPRPGSSELSAVLPSGMHELYRVLYERRDDPPTRAEWLAAVEERTGQRHSQSDRRTRDLYEVFDIERLPPASHPRYLLRGWATTARQPRINLSNRLRAEVLASQRCAMCGKTPLEDSVRLVVDHLLPLDWGGSNDPDNLQPLCEQCNAGKKNYFATFGGAELVARAAREPEPHRRIGELLRGQLGTWVPGPVIAAVASRGAFQEDWQKRTRELRVLGWTIRARRRRDADGRTVVDYCATAVGDWPEGNIAAEIRRRGPQKRFWRDLYGT